MIKRRDLELSAHLPQPRQAETEYVPLWPETRTALSLGGQLYDRIKDGGPRRVVVARIGNDHLVFSALVTLLEPRVVRGRLPSRAVASAAYCGTELVMVSVDYYVSSDHRPYCDTLQTACDASDPALGFAQTMDALSLEEREDIVFALQTAVATTGG